MKSNLFRTSSELQEDYGQYRPKYLTHVENQCREMQLSRSHTASVKSTTTNIKVNFKPFQKNIILTKSKLKQSGDFELTPKNDKIKACRIVSLKLPKELDRSVVHFERSSFVHQPNQDYRYRLGRWSNTHNLETNTQKSINYLDALLQEQEPRKEHELNKHEFNNKNTVKISFKTDTSLKARSTAYLDNPNVQNDRQSTSKLNYPEDINTSKSPVKQENIPFDQNTQTLYFKQYFAKIQNIDEDTRIIDRDKAIEYKIIIDEDKTIIDEDKSISDEEKNIFEEHQSNASKPRNNNLQSKKFHLLNNGKQHLSPSDGTKTIDSQNSMRQSSNSKATGKSTSNSIPKTTLEFHSRGKLQTNRTSIDSKTKRDGSNSKPIKEEFQKESSALRSQTSASNQRNKFINLSNMLFNNERIQEVKKVLRTRHKVPGLNKTSAPSSNADNKKNSTTSSGVESLQGIQTNSKSNNTQSQKPQSKNIMKDKTSDSNNSSSSRASKLSTRGKITSIPRNKNRSERIKNQKTYKRESKAITMFSDSFNNWVKKTMNTKIPSKENSVSPKNHLARGSTKNSKKERTRSESKKRVFEKVMLPKVARPNTVPENSPKNSIYRNIEVKSTDNLVQFEDSTNSGNNSRTEIANTSKQENDGQFDKSNFHAFRLQSNVNQTFINSYKNDTQITDHTFTEKVEQSKEAENFINSIDKGNDPTNISGLGNTNKENDDCTTGGCVKSPFMGIQGLDKFITSCKKNYHLRLKALEAEQNEATRPKESVRIHETIGNKASTTTTDTESSQHSKPKTKPSALKQRNINSNILKNKGAKSQKEEEPEEPVIQIVQYFNKNLEPPAWQVRESLFPNIPPYLVFNTYNAESRFNIPETAKQLLKWKWTTGTPSMIKTIVENSGFRIIKSEFTRESNQWLGCWGRHLKPPMFMRLKEIQKLNHFPGTFIIGRKDRLWSSMQLLRDTHGAADFNFIPETYIIPKDLELLKENWDSTNSTTEEKWIIKPPACSRGYGIKIIHKWSQLPNKYAVVQRYISSPYLINGNKFDLRVYVLITSYNPLRIYLSKDGLARFAAAKYSTDYKNLKDRFVHLTNYSVNKWSSQYTVNVDANACHGHKWTLRKLWDYMKQNGVDTENLWEKIKDMIIKTIISGESTVTPLCMEHMRSRYNCYELYGFDILIDSSLKLWLLEVNISPSLHGQSPLDCHIKGELLKSIFEIIQFHVPPRAEYVNEACTPPVQNINLYTTALLRKERMKQSSFCKMKNRKEYLGAILQDLTGDDIRHLIQAEDELAALGVFERIFPTAKTHPYLKYMGIRYYNRLFDAWETKYENSRTVGLFSLKRMCDQKLHLKPAQHNKTSRVQLTADLMRLSGQKPKEKEIQASMSDVSFTESETSSASRSTGSFSDDDY